MRNKSSKLEPANVSVFHLLGSRAFHCSVRSAELVGATMSYAWELVSDDRMQAVWNSVISISASTGPV